jgi:hypothetical protein
MENTLSYSDVIQRTGYTTIDGVRVVQYTCLIPADRPLDMRIGITKLNPDLYKANRDICRADYAAFEDAAYKLQEEYVAKLGD